MFYTIQVRTPEKSPRGWRLWPEHRITLEEAVRVINLMNKHNVQVSTVTRGTGVTSTGYHVCGKGHPATVIIRSVKPR